MGRVFNIQKFSINDGPGIRTTVFFWGCPLRCRWCSNPESQLRNRSLAGATGDPSLCGREISPEEVLREVEQDRLFYEDSGGGMTLSGGEPLKQPDFALDLLCLARSRGIHCVMETTGFAAEETFEAVARHLDLLLMDVKHWNSDIHLQQTGVRNELILKNLRKAVSIGIPVIARIPVIPGFNDSLRDAENLTALLLDFGVTEAHLLPFHQFGEKKYEQLGLAYDLRGVPQLHPENLSDYREQFLRAGLVCEIK